MKLTLKFVNVVAMTVLLAGCSFGGGTRPLAELRGGLSERDYHLKSGDVVNIDVWGEPSISGEVTVRQDGRLSVP